MKWRHISQFYAISGCEQYELTGRYTDGHFAWRGRLIATDRLIASSQDRGYVERQCAADARAAIAEDSA